jgi:hypothetical protein
MSGNASIAILNPLNSKMRAVTLGVKFNVTLNLDLPKGKGNILKAEASNIDLDVMTSKVLFYSTERLDMIRKKFKLIQPVFDEAFNKSISLGLELPIPENFKDKFQIKNLKFFKKYFLIEFDSEVVND